MEHNIDATNKTLGRVATEAASILIGKTSASFERNKAGNQKVRISNASHAVFSDKKKTTVTYARYSGYPGGLKKESMDNLSKRKGFREIFRKAIYGMIPANKNRAIIMKNLVITE